jgi:hypothetical protein
MVQSTEEANRDQVVGKYRQKYGGRAIDTTLPS